MMSQSYTDIECIIVDDATKDDSIKKCERLIGDYEGSVRFRILHHKYNRGISAARNTGTDAAIGEYIFYLDGDDVITQDCIEKLIRPIIKDKTIEMVTGGYMRVSDDYPISPSEQPSKRKSEDIASHEAVRDYHFSKNYLVTAWNKLIKRDFLLQHQLYFKEGALFEVSAWLFFVMKYLSHLHVISDVTYLWYKRPNSITTGTSKNEKARHWCLAYEVIANNFTPGESGKEAKFYIRKFCRRCICYPDNQTFVRVSHLFEKALAGSQYKKERVILALTVFMSKTTVGRRFYIFALKLRAMLKVKEIRLNKQC